MDRLDQMTAYVAILEEGSLAAAARRLGSSPPAVSRALVALEERLGVPLIRRTTRRLAPTEAGLRYFKTCQRLLADIEAADREATGEGGEPHGLLRVTAPLLFGRMYVAPVVTAFVERHREARAELMLIDRIVDLIDEGVDVAIRIGQLPDSSLVARKVGQVCRVLVASPDYLARRGTPHTLRDLASHDVIAFSIRVLSSLSVPSASLRRSSPMNSGAVSWRNRRKRQNRLGTGTDVSLQVGSNT